MLITPGGIIFICVLATLIGGIYLFNNWRQGKKVDIPKANIFKRVKQDENTTLCFNIYASYYKVETMLTKGLYQPVRTCEIGNKPGIIQMNILKEYKPYVLSDKIGWPAERAARMIGCKDLRKLKAMKFSLLEQLATFAPVAAIAIGVLLFIIVMG